MKKVLPAVFLVIPLSGCLNGLAGDGEPVGTQGNKVLYEAGCTVDLSTAGQQGLLGTGTIPLHGYCEVAAENRCGEGNFDITNVERSNRRMVTDTIQNGPYVQRRTYPAENQVIQFVCRA